MKKILSILFIILCTSASVLAFGVDSTMKTVMDSWKGCHIDKVIDRWGYPTEEKTVAGHKLYIWKTERTVTTSASTTTKPHTDKKGRTYYTTSTYGGNTEIYTTERTIEVDENNLVVRGTYGGNDLPFTFMGVAKDWLNPTYELAK